MPSGEKRPESGPAALGSYDALIEERLAGPYWVVDILPEQVPAGASGQYPSAAQYFLRPNRVRALRRRLAEILLRLNCYEDMDVSFDWGENWERNPDPESFAARVEALSAPEYLRAMFPETEVMIDLDCDDTYMTVYDPGSRLLDRLRSLAGAEGLFVWHPEDTGGGI